MKHIFFWGLIIFCSQNYLLAQNNATEININTYKQFPAFKLLNTDSVVISSLSIIKKGKPTLLMYFSPTCGHCQQKTEELTGHIKDFSDVQILMVSAYALSDIKTFANGFGLFKFSNIKLAYDPDFKLGSFYKLTSLPGLYLYDKNGLFIQKFDPNATVSEMIEALHAK